MPWHVQKSGRCPKTMPFAVIKDATGEIEACHATPESADAHVARLYQSEGDSKTGAPVPMGGADMMMGRSAPAEGAHYRAFRPDLGVRAGGDGRTVFGIAVPYDAPTRIDDQLVEQFVRGAFAHQLAAPQRVKFAREHVLLGGTLIGALTMMRDDAAGLYVEMRASKTPVGDETLELVRDGALSELSIMFEERQNRVLQGGVVARVKANLREVAVVMAGAYGELATAAGVRSAGAGGSYPTGAIVTDAQLRNAAAEYMNLPDAPDNDLEIRRIRLGLRASL